MTEETLHAAKRLHCREIDGERTGILILSEDRTEMYFVDYENYVHVADDAPTYVITEEGRVVSLHANVPGRHSTVTVSTKSADKGGHRQEDEHIEIFQSGIISNRAIIGVDAWRPEHLVRQLTFSVAYTENILRNPEKLRSLGSSSRPAEDDLKLYRVAVGNTVMTAGYSATYGNITRSLTSYQPTFTIEFTEGCPLNEIEIYLAHYLTFLSLVLGGRMAPAGVLINRRSFEETVSDLNAGTYIPNHAIMWNWPADKYEAGNLAFHGAPFVAENAQELAALEAGLVVWLERSNSWERAYMRMSDSLSLRHVVSGERLLAACRWFEELPNAKPDEAFDGDTLEPVIQAALNAARAQALSDVENRIRGSLRKIGFESMRDQYTRLLDSVQSRFDNDDFFANMIDHLMTARNFRGRVAHGHFAARDEKEMQRFNKATLAMEALSFLLTIRDLPMTDAGRQRVWSHPVLEHYGSAYE